MNAALGNRKKIVLTKFEGCICARGRPVVFNFNNTAPVNTRI